MKPQRKQPLRHNTPSHWFTHGRRPCLWLVSKKSPRLSQRLLSSASVADRVHGEEPGEKKTTLCLISSQTTHFLEQTTCHWIPFGDDPLNIGTIQIILARPLRKDDTHRSRSVNKTLFHEFAHRRRPCPRQRIIQFNTTQTDITRTREVGAPKPQSHVP